MSAPTASTPTVRMLCPRTGCPGQGHLVDVDAAALTFARAEKNHVRCAGCRRPLIPLPLPPRTAP